ncbi:putative asparagine synthetase domain-containing protein 1-like [Capsicum annuum]|nr:putative asparagine synthetase domain-containing protein 1-like [Capsicum annuum]
MGNSLAICFTRNQASTKINKNRSSSSSHSHSLISPPYNFSKSTSQRLDKVPPKETSATRSTLDDDYIKEQARVAAALLLQHHHQNGTLTQFGRSVSLRDPLASSKKQKRIPRSSSSRPRLLSDSLPQHLEILNQCTKLGSLETKHFVLIHGGACVPYAMELHRSKVSKAVFIAAAMLKNGQSVLDMFSMQIASNDLCQHSQKFLYANGKNQPPTTIDYEKSLLKDVMFDQTTAKGSKIRAGSPFQWATEEEREALAEKLFEIVNGISAISDFKISLKKEYYKDRDEREK